MHTCSTSMSSWLSFSSSSFCSLVTLSRSNTTALQLSSLLKLTELDISLLKALLSHLVDERKRAWMCCCGRPAGCAVAAPYRSPQQDSLLRIRFTSLICCCCSPLHFSSSSSEAAWPSTDRRSCSSTRNHRNTVMWSFLLRFSHHRNNS